MVRNLYEMYLPLWLKETRFAGSLEAKHRNLVALSFDDGPHEEYTAEILEILRRYNCQGTFFWIVEHAQQLALERQSLFQEIVAQIQEGGHEVGLHAPYDYEPTLTSRLLGKFTREEMTEAKEQLEDLTGLPIRFYRPHYLQIGSSIVFARELGLVTVAGDIFHYARPDRPSKAQIERFSSAGPGSILLFHDGTSMERRETYVTDVLPSVLDNLQKKGLRCTSLSNVL